jgi:calcium-independent phospholipase A2
VDSIRCNPKWTSAHIAAKTGLDNLFINSPNDITSNLNAQKEPDFSTPLHLVIQSGRVSTTKALLALKPRLDLRDQKLNTALHFAAMSEKDILVLILKEPNILEKLKWTNKKYCTPLHLSCFANKSDNVLEFLRFGVTVQMMTVSSPEKKQKTLFDDKKIIRFTQEDIDDLDTEDMIYGGTPLHWVKHRRTLEKLLKMGFGLDVVNVMGETALYTMVKRLRLKCMIGLLCNGAGVEVSNRSGDCPLHCAVKAADVTSTQALIVFDANIDAINKKKESARHMAAKAGQADHQMVLYLLTAIGAKRCDSHMKGCSPGCAHNGTYEGKPYHRWPLYHNETLYKEGLLEPVIREALKRQNQPIDHKSRRVRMICLDGMHSRRTYILIIFYVNIFYLTGGGIRGLITIQIMIELEKHLKNPISNYFEWIAGTSTGSIEAMLLATGRPLVEIRSIYFKLKDQIFVGSRPYSSANFEKILENEIGSKVTMSDIQTTFNKKLIINATLIDRNPAQLHVFRSFESPEEILGLPDTPPGFKSYPNSTKQIAWKACRASGAAPTYFQASGPFLDGGLIANNPTLDAMSEFRYYNNALRAVGRGEEREKLDLVLSLGTGRFPLTKAQPIDVLRMWSFNPKEIHKNTLYIKQIGSLLINEVTNTEGHVINRAQSWCSWIRVPYFRVNPPLSEMLALDETSDVEIANTMWETKAYMWAIRKHIHKIVQLLSPQQTIPKTSQTSLHSVESFESQSTAGYSLSLSLNHTKTPSETTTNNSNSNQQIL